MIDEQKEMQRWGRDNGKTVTTMREFEVASEPERERERREKKKLRRSIRKQRALCRAGEEIVRHSRGKSHGSHV